MISIQGDDFNQMKQFTEWLNQMPAPSIYEYYKSQVNRILSIDSEISDEYDTLQIVRRIIEWNMEDIGKPAEERKPILLFIFSPLSELFVSVI